LISQVKEVITYVWPYDYWHDRYQAYYRVGLREHLAAVGGKLTEESVGRHPSVLRMMRRLRDSHKVGRVLGVGTGRRVLDAVALMARGSGSSPSGLFHPLVGQYLFRLTDGSVLNVCVDAEDSGSVASPALLDWCSLYFKTNYWPSFNYDPKVAPLCNGNPLLLGRISKLRALRSVPSSYDVCFVVRLRGGSYDEEKLEHNIRFLEALARTPCSKYLLGYLVAGDIPAQERRLAAQGIPTTRVSMPLKQLWDVSSRSRLNILRLGMHACVPWRMMDMLAIGAAPLLDQLPFTLWPHPLEEEKHFFSLGAITPSSRAVAEDAFYRDVPEMVMSLLTTSERIDAMRGTTAGYFDEHVSPNAVGAHMCGAVMHLAARGSID
jgi:hypothetical protein